jgi:renierapurpurin 18,18'-hydroxylase
MVASDSVSVGASPAVAQPVPGTAPGTTPERTPLRELGINPNHWYVLARSSELTDKPLGLTLWQQPLVLYRDRSGQVHALEDRCPHRQVKLSEGQVSGNEIVCAYHGWHFDASGACSHVPYLEANQKLPSCSLRTYPVREQDGFIWVFPGDPAQLAAHPLEPLSLPEWEHLNYIATVSLIDVQAHYSFLIENLMDMYHGHLHADYQAWTQPVLQSLEATDQRVDAHYQAQSYYRIDKIWSISQLFIPALRQLHPEPLDVSYAYPNWVATLGQDFKICCLFSPVGPSHTRAYLIHFTSLQAFPNLHKQPLWFRRFLKNRLFGSAQKMLDGLVEQDIVMLEQEQQAYLAAPHRKGPELNRALVSVQKLIRQQASQAP